MPESGPTGPKKFPKKVTLDLDDYSALKELAGATGSDNPVELINLAMTTLAWVVRNSKEGRTILAIGGESDIEDQELVLELPPEHGE